MSIQIFENTMDRWCDIRNIRNLLHNFYKLISYKLWRNNSNYHLLCWSGTNYCKIYNTFCIFQLLEYRKKNRVIKSIRGKRTNARVWFNLMIHVHVRKTFLESENFRPIKNCHVIHQVHAVCLKQPITKCHVLLSGSHYYYLETNENFLSVST